MLSIALRTSINTGANVADGNVISGKARAGPIDANTNVLLLKHAQGLSKEIGKFNFINFVPLVLWMLLTYALHASTAGPKRNYVISVNVQNRETLVFQKCEHHAVLNHVCVDGVGLKSSGTHDG